MAGATRGGWKLDLATLSVDEMYECMVRVGVFRAYILYRDGALLMSHPSLLSGVERFLHTSQDFAQHEGIFIGRAHDVPTLFIACVHDTRRGLAQGGVRTLQYANLGEALVDGLRLSVGMTRKNALAGLWWGGGKGIIPQTEALAEGRFLEHGSPLRRRLFSRYGEFVASLGGVYYMAEDVGTRTEDMDAALARNRFTTCVSRAVGGSGNPSAFTARGVLRGIEAGWAVLSGDRDLRGVHAAVQGLGHVGVSLVGELLGVGAEVSACDVDPLAIKRAVQRFPEIHVVGCDEIYDVPADVFAPCAVGAVIRPETIERLRVRLVCGAANNILSSPGDADRLERRGIAYVPDFLCNRMGIVNCCNEPWGYLEEDVAQAAERVFPDTLEVFEYARRHRCTTEVAADLVADREAARLHPMHGHRGRKLIDQLVDSGWHEDGQPEPDRLAGPQQGIAAMVGTLNCVQDGSIRR